MDTEADIVVAMDVVGKESKTRLKERFLLDGLAELLLREKMSRGKLGEGKKAGHVAAAAMVEEAEQTTVYLAENGGLDHVDVGMLRLLEVWMRAIANGGRRPLNAEGNVVWGRTDGIGILCEEA